MTRLIPNILTLGRLVLTAIFLAMILYSPRVPNKPVFLDTAFALFIVAGITDVIDGAIARKFNVATKFGRMMDPLVDKVLVCGAFVCFAIIGEPKLFSLPAGTLRLVLWTIAGITILREIYVTILRHIAEARGVNFSATASGKIKMFIQSFAIGAILIKVAHAPTAAWGHWLTTVMLLIMLIVTVVSGLSATRRPSWKQASG